MIGPGTAHVKLYIAKKALPQADTLNILIPTYTIQLGSFANEQNAYDLSHKVQGSRVEIVQIDDKFRYRVYYGLYTAYNNAREAQEKLSEKKAHLFCSTNCKLWAELSYSQVITKNFLVNNPD